MNGFAMLTEHDISNRTSFFFWWRKYIEYFDSVTSVSKNWLFLYEREGLEAAKLPTPSSVQCKWDRLWQHQAYMSKELNCFWSFSIFPISKGMHTVDPCIILFQPTEFLFHSSPSPQLVFHSHQTVYMSPPSKTSLSVKDIDIAVDWRISYVIHVYSLPHF